MTQSTQTEYGPRAESWLSNPTHARSTEPPSKLATFYFVAKVALLNAGKGGKHNDIKVALCYLGASLCCGC